MQLMAKRSSERPSYGELVQRLTGVLARIDPDSVPQLLSERERSRPMPLPSREEPDESSTDLPVRSGGAGMPVWLVVVTLGCIALFVAGLVTYLSRDDAAPAAATTGDAGHRTGSGSGATTPAGMTLVKHPDGTPWFYVDERPVTSAAYHNVFADHEQTGSADDPAVMVSYDAARSYASSRHGRLLRPDEWDAAANSSGVVVADGIFEWVESPEGKKQVRQHGKSQIRPDKEQKDVGFRVARDP